jgi:hypothetical protein
LKKDLTDIRFLFLPLARSLGRGATSAVCWNRETGTLHSREQMLTYIFFVRIIYSISGIALTMWNKNKFT